MTKRLFVFWVVAFLASVAFGAAKKELLFKENFENSEECKLLDIAKFGGEMKGVAGADAISGEASLELSTLSNTGWGSLMKIPLKGSNGYEIELKLKVLETNPSADIFLVGREEKNGEVVRRLTLVRINSDEKKVIKDRVRFLANPQKDYHFDITTNRGARVVIDDLKVHKIKFDSDKGAWMFDEDAFVGMTYKPTNMDFCGLNSPFLSMSKEEFFPFIDKFGQFKHRDWVDKIRAESDFAERIKAENAYYEKIGEIANRDKFGGLIDPKYKFEATGKFYTKKIKGRWFFITPEGNIFYSYGITCAGIPDSIPYTFREHYFEDVSDKRFISKSGGGLGFYKGKKFEQYGFVESNLTKKYGENFKNVYGAVADERMKKWGMNTYGAWSQKYIMERDNVPYTATLSSYVRQRFQSNIQMFAYWFDFPDFFAPDFESKTKERVMQSKKLLDSPMCLGVFIDNELPWQHNTLTTIRALLSCPATQPSKIAFMCDLQEKYGDIENLNAKWNSQYKSWDDFLAERKFHPKTKAGEADMLKFEKKIYERYFRICRDAVREASPKTLYLGCRFAWRNKLVEQVASRYCDVVSINVYTTNVTDFKLVKGCKDKPILIGEYHFGACDKGVFGGGLNPRRTTKERADAFDEYTVSAMENPNIAGAHWFAWFDLCTAGRFNGANYSMGFMDVCDTPDYVIVDRARKLAEKLYDIRLSGNKTTKQKEVDGLQVIE